ncbi:MAG: hypothetical protein V3V15_06580 [Sphingorhabdus sp.]
MQFRLEEDTEANRFKRIISRGGSHRIYASGEIEESSADELRKLVSANNVEHARVYFDSPGGSLIGGLKLGETIRELGFDTDIRSIDYEYEKGPVAICASACSYAFAGGVNRFFDEGPGRLGLHQFYGSDSNIGDVGLTQRISGTIVSYLDRMGVNAKSFSIASLTDKSEMTWLTASQAISIGLANNGVEPTTSEIKLTEGHPYLKLEQHYDTFTARVLIFHYDGEFSVMAGIVTNEETAAEQVGYFNMNYLEFDQSEYERMKMPEGLEVQGSVIWMSREMSSDGLAMLMTSDMLGMWMEAGGAMRWGGYIDLKPVRNDIKNFVGNFGS